MDEGRCEVNTDTECAWYQIYLRLRERGVGTPLAAANPPRDFARNIRPGSLKLEK
jgi:hypothetical protein